MSDVDKKPAGSIPSAESVRSFCAELNSLDAMRATTIDYIYHMSSSGFMSCELRTSNMVAEDRKMLANELIDAGYTVSMTSIGIMVRW